MSDGFWAAVSLAALLLLFGKWEPKDTGRNSVPPQPSVAAPSTEKSK